MVSIGIPAPPSPRAALDAAPPPYNPRGDRSGYLRLDLNEDLSGPLAHPSLPRGGALGAYPTTHALQHDLAHSLQVAAASIRVTAGADEAIYGLLRAYVDPGDTVLLPWPTFGEFVTAAGTLGASLEYVPYGPDLAFPLDAYRAALAQAPRVAVLVTPANPTGELIPPTVVLELAASAPGTLVIVDEAYAEYGGSSILDLGMPPLNVAVIRTFSKAYGLAAARVGYLIADARILRGVRQVLPSFSLAGPSLAYAQTGLARREALTRRVHAVHKGQRRIARWGRLNGITVHTTAANFVLLRLPSDTAARALAEALEAHGILVADRTAVLPGALRVAVGPPRHVGVLLRALERIRDGEG